MKTLRFLLIALLIVLPVGKQQAQTEPKVNTAPDSQYKVHREYDENGNLIGYDSTAITTWSYSSSGNEPDSVLNYWSYTPSINDSSSFNYGRSKHYGFKLPGDEFAEWPQFDLDIYFRDRDSVLKGFEYNFSLTPRDTSYHFNDPYFDFYGQFPPIQPDIQSYMQDMQRMIDDMLNHHDKMFREFYEEEYQPVPFDETESDSIPVQPIPSPAPQKYTGPQLNI